MLVEKHPALCKLFDKVEPEATAPLAALAPDPAVHPA